MRRRAVRGRGTDRVNGPGDASTGSHSGPGRLDPAVGHLQGVAGGDASAFQQLYDATSGTLFGICTRILGDRVEAEEALQDTYLAIWRKAATFDPERGSAGAWIATLARHCAIDRLRGRSRIAAAPIELADDVPDGAMLAPDLIERGETRAKLEGCLQLLAPADGILIRSAFFQGSSYAELAVRTDRPLGTIKSRIRRALQKLAECLQ